MLKLAEKIIDHRRILLVFGIAQALEAGHETRPGTGFELIEIGSRMRLAFVFRHDLYPPMLRFALLSSIRRAIVATAAAGGLDGPGHPADGIGTIAAERQGPPRFLTVVANTPRSGRRPIPARPRISFAFSNLSKTVISSPGSSSETAGPHAFIYKN